MCYGGLVLLCLAHLVEFSGSQECSDGQIYDSRFSRCCENFQCSAGSYYNCTTCSDCPKGTFLGRSSKEDLCLSYTTCDDHQIEIYPGNATHDRECGTEEDKPPSTSTQPSSTSASSMDHETTPSTENGGLSPLLIAIIIFVLVVLVILAARIIWKKKCQGRTAENDHGSNLLGDNVAHQNGSRGHARIKHLDLEEEAEIAKKNIRGNYSTLSKDMDSDKGLFWAALKEGEGSYTLDDHQACLNMTSSARNTKILDLAQIGSKKIRSLVYALCLTEQSSLANLISETISKTDFRDKSDKWTHGNNFKEMLRNNRVYILKNLDLSEGLWSHLRDHDKFTIEDYENCKRKATEFESKDYLIDLMLKDEQKYSSFLNALENTESPLFENFTEVHQEHPIEYKRLLREDQVV